MATIFERGMLRICPIYVPSDQSGSVLENHLKVRSILLKGISNSGGIGLPQSQAQLRVKSRGKRIWISISMSKASKGREVPLNNRYCQHLLDQAVRDDESVPCSHK